MLKMPSMRAYGVRTLSGRDVPDVLRVLDTDPIASCMIAARVEEIGLDARQLHGQLWARGAGKGSLCFSGANLVPLSGGPDDVRAFADRAARTPRVCSSLVGRAELTIPLWEELRADWGPPREVRAEQPLLAVTSVPDQLIDREVRQVQPSELGAYFPVAVAMFREEVGVDPLAGDGGVGYRRRIASLIDAGRAYARFDDGRVVFKAEVGSLSRAVGQIQGVWVAPDLRGHGLGTGGTAAVAATINAGGRVASLYVNSFNTPARRAYARIGFHQVGTFTTVLLD